MLKDPDAITPADPLPHTIQASGEQQEQKFGDHAPPHEPTDPHATGLSAGWQRIAQNQME